MNIQNGEIFSIETPIDYFDVGTILKVEIMNAKTLLVFYYKKIIQLQKD